MACPLLRIPLPLKKPELKSHLHKTILDSHKEYILQVRVGATDFPLVLASEGVCIIPSMMSCRLRNVFRIS